MNFYEVFGISLDGQLAVDPEIDSRILRTAPMHINIAYDGAREDDADCEYILGACCAIAGFSRILITRVKEGAGLDPAIKLHQMSDEQQHLWRSVARGRTSAEIWFTRAAENRRDSVGAKLARRMLDASVSLEVKKKNLSVFPEYLEDFLYKSPYYTNL